MNAWEELKKLLNEKKHISKDKLRYKIYSKHQIKHITLERYFDILASTNYIKIQYKYDKPDSFIPFCVLAKKIPEKLTTSDAEKMYRMPWLEWFKYGE